jgi:4-hydroxy-3-methylbut-2-enyl diphosphate reductase
MEVIKAKSAGFCFGVARAVELAQELAQQGGRARMLGTVIHNDHVVADLARQGMDVITSPQQAGAGDRVLLRAHGESRRVYDELEARGAIVVDATCPKVAKVQQIVSQAEAEGRQPVMIGDPNHPEVIGIAGWCKNLLVFPGPNELAKWLETLDNKEFFPITMVSQTTLIREIWENSKKIIN